MATLLDPKLILLKTRNYYLWESNKFMMPKGAINYRWSCIPSFGQKLLSQLLQVQNHGYCLPHLRWQHIFTDHFIQQPVYPCQLEPKGIIKQVIAFANLRPEDPYCAP